jgi:hypothetical protein
VKAFYFSLPWNKVLNLAIMVKTGIFERFLYPHEVDWLKRNGIVLSANPSDIYIEPQRNLEMLLLYIARRIDRVEGNILLEIFPYRESRVYDSILFSLVESYPLTIEKFRLIDARKIYTNPFPERYFERFLEDNGDSVIIVWNLFWGESYSKINFKLLKDTERRKVLFISRPLPKKDEKKLLSKRIFWKYIKFNVEKNRYIKHDKEGEK